jgi:hypothetical protein
MRYIGRYGGLHLIGIIGMYSMYEADIQITTDKENSIKILRIEWKTIHIIMTMEMF